MTSFWWKAFLGWLVLEAAVIVWIVTVGPDVNTFFKVAGFFAAPALGLIYAAIDKKIRLRRPKLSFEFHNESNDPLKVSPFKVSYVLLPNGQPIKHHLAEHHFYLGLHNHADSTLRNARVMINTISMPGYPVYRPLIAKQTGTDRVDIQPQATEFFVVGGGYDSERVGNSKICPPPYIDQLADELSKLSIGFTIRFAQGNPAPLLKNDGYIVSLTASADDTLPINGAIRINAKNRIEVWLEEPDAASAPHPRRARLL